MAEPTRYVTAARAAPHGYLPCARCWKLRPLSEFHRNVGYITRNGGYAAVCRECVHETRTKDPDRHGKGWHKGEVQTYCKRGHPQTPDNVRETPVQRMCRICWLERQRNWRVAHPATASNLVHHQRRSPRERYLSFVYQSAVNAWQRLQDSYVRGNVEVWVIRYDRWLEVKAWLWEALEDDEMPDWNAA